jgi:hypothetical protein
VRGNDHPFDSIRNLWGQAGTPLGATGTQNLTATHGAHAGTESMSALAPGIMWLKSSFHDLDPMFLPVRCFPRQALKNGREIYLSAAILSSIKVMIKPVDKSLLPV